MPAARALGLDLGFCSQRGYSDQAGRQDRKGPDRDSRLGIDADLTSLKLDNILPGLGQAAGQVQPRRFSTWLPKTANRPALKTL